MEGFKEQKDRFFSEEQNKKLEKLVEIIRPLYFSLNSDQAFELSGRIGKLRETLEKQDLKPEKYLLWSLITEGGTLDNSDTNQEFDTQDGQIENFILSLKELENDEIAA